MTQMINTETNNNGVAIPASKQDNGIGFSSLDKQLPGPIKKIALRDVQNQSSGFAQNHQESATFLAGGASTDAVIVCGNKKLTPERASGSSFYPALTNPCANEHIMNARRRFELELGRGGIQSNINKFAGSPQSRKPHQLQQETPPKQTQLRASNSYCAPVATQNNMPPVSSSSSEPSAPKFPGKYSTGMQCTQSDSLKVTLDCPSYVDRKGGTRVRKMMERYIRLQKFLKQCDESNCRDYIKVLRHQTAAELSRHAFEAEARAIQLAMEEGKEMHRMKALNILGKSTLADNSLQTTFNLTSNSTQSTQLHPRQ